jgi:hypothetical protein
MRFARQTLIASMTLLAFSLLSPCGAQTTPDNAATETVLRRPDPNHIPSAPAPTSPLKRLFEGFKTKKKLQSEKNQRLAEEQQAWDQRVAEIIKVIHSFPLVKADNNQYYFIWNEDYPNWIDSYDRCITTHIPGDSAVTPTETLEPRTARYLPPASVVNQCLSKVNDGYSKILAYKACERSSKAQISRLSKSITNARVLVKLAEMRLAKDKKIESMTGVADLDLQHQMAEIIVDGNQEIESDFEKYQQLGGTAAIPKDVEETRDPCR